MSGLERILKIVNGKALLVNVHGNLVRTYYANGDDDATRVDWYDREQETVLIQLVSGKSIIVTKYGNIQRVI